MGGKTGEAYNIAGNSVNMCVYVYVGWAGIHPGFGRAGSERAMKSRGNGSRQCEGQMRVDLLVG